MIRAGSGEPLVLLHGVTSSERAWARVVPRLAPHHDTIALTALGHRGGPMQVGHVSIASVVDDAERQLDALEIGRAHLAGNSMGGWVALELARRGRAHSVCAFSPAGCWHPGGADQRRATGKLRTAARATRLSRLLTPLLARPPWLRRRLMRLVATRGDEITAQDFIDSADDMLACTAREDLLSTCEQLAPFDPLPCPVVLAWSGCDRLFPPAINGALARLLMPQAEYLELPGVGHVPMLDDASLVARTILHSTRRAVVKSTALG